MKRKTLQNKFQVRLYLQDTMNFDVVVERARQLHTEGVEENVVLQSSYADQIDGNEVFGRICNTVDATPPLVLSETPGRQTVFVFGPDSVSSIILQRNTYDCLCSLGFDRDYIYHEVVEKKCKYWLVLFTRSALKLLPNSGQIVTATWEGVLQTVKATYPKAYQDTLSHFDEVYSKTVADFEQEAGFRFLDAKKNIDGNYPSAPPFHSYSHFLSLPQPRRAWQVRLFLYCELRLLSLFKGDGYTRLEDGRTGTREYLCPNLPLSVFDQSQLAILPMPVTIPQAIHQL